jgi:hypothetical protein
MTLMSSSIKLTFYINFNFKHLSYEKPLYQKAIYLFKMFSKEILTLFMDCFYNSFNYKDNIIEFKADCFKMSRYTQSSVSKNSKPQIVGATAVGESEQVYITSLIQKLGPSKPISVA